MLSDDFNKDKFDRNFNTAVRAFGVAWGIGALVSLAGSGLVLYVLYRLIVKYL
jgi:hypothetical protein